MREGTPFHFDSEDHKSFDSGGSRRHSPARGILLNSALCLSLVASGGIGAWCIRDRISPQGENLRSVIASLGEVRPQDKQIFADVPVQVIIEGEKQRGIGSFKIPQLTSSAAIAVTGECSAGIDNTKNPQSFREDGGLVVVEVGPVVIFGCTAVEVKHFAETGFLPVPTSLRDQMADAARDQMQRSAVSSRILEKAERNGESAIELYIRKFSKAIQNVRVIFRRGDSSQDNRPRSTSTPFPKVTR